MSLEPGQPSGWNPLLLDDTEENRVFLYGLLSFMLKPSKECESLTPQEESIIRNAIKSVLKTKDRSYRRLSSLRALLAGSERTEGSLIARLDKWVDINNNDFSYYSSLYARTDHFLLHGRS